jgi:aspartyl-tRNA(Asn)/glutamyl-tRNA(Gln) amidotransferase subunit A
MYIADAYTVPSALAGLPGISVPCGFATSGDAEQEKLPVGLQLLAARLDEEKLLKIAHVFEQNTDWKDQMTPEGYED